MIAAFTNFSIKQERKTMNFVHLLLFSFVLLVSLQWAEGGQSISGDDLLRPRRSKNGVCDGPGRATSFKCRACCEKCSKIKVFTMFQHARRQACEKKCCAVCNFWLKPEERPCWVLVWVVPIWDTWTKKWLAYILDSGYHGCQFLIKIPYQFDM